MFNEIIKDKKRRNALIQKFFGIKVYLWIVLLATILLGAFYMYGKIIGGKNRENGISQSYSMVKYIEKTNQHVFLNVGIEEVVTETNDTKILWDKITIPYSKKKVIVILNYEAKLGIKKPVQIKKISGKRYRIIVPKFEFVGLALDKKKPYDLYDKSGELLSYSTEDIDTGKIATEKLLEKNQEKYLKKYQDSLRESAKEYYQSLFKAVDTNIQLDIVFSE